MITHGDHDRRGRTHLDVDSVEGAGRHEARDHRAHDGRGRRACRKAKREGDGAEHERAGEAAADARRVHDTRAHKGRRDLRQRDEGLCTRVRTEGHRGGTAERRRSRGRPQQCDERQEVASRPNAL